MTFPCDSHSLCNSIQNSQQWCFWVLQAAMEAIDMCMEEMQLHFMSPVGISGYNKDFEVQLKSEDDRPQHDMRDHDCLKDACHLLLIAVDASAANYEKAFRLLSSEVSLPTISVDKYWALLSTLHVLSLQNAWFEAPRTKWDSSSALKILNHKSLNFRCRRVQVLKLHILYHASVLWYLRSQCHLAHVDFKWIHVQPSV